MNLNKKLNIFRFLIIVPIFLSIVAMGNGQSIYQCVPDKIEKKAKYLFYLHGRIIEVKGIRPTSEKYGVYEYEKILETLKNRGFRVISEARKKNTNIGSYAQKIVSQIKVLLEGGVPPRNITVVGASKGAIIAMQASTMLGNKEINFVFIAGCNDMIFQKFDIAFYGNILSIYDEKDEIAGTCQKFFKNSAGINKYKEIKLNCGMGHGILYKPLKEWIEPVVDWTRQSK